MTQSRRLWGGTPNRGPALNGRPASRRDHAEEHSHHRWGGGVSPTARSGHCVKAFHENHHPREEGYDAEDHSQSDHCRPQPRAGQAICTKLRQRLGEDFFSRQALIPWTTLWPANQAIDSRPLIQSMPDERLDDIVFYRFGRDSKDPRYSMWAFVFFRHAFFVVATRPETGVAHSAADSGSNVAEFKCRRGGASDGPS